MSFDAILQRLQNVAPFNIHKVNSDGTTEPWFNVTGPTITQDLLLSETNLVEQVQTVNGRISYWGRLAAQAKRVWEIKEREYRIWRSTQYLLIKQDGGKHTEKEVDSMVRVRPGYSELYAKVEAAEEAFNACTAVLDAWKAKLQVMKMALYRRNTEDGGVLSL